MVNVYNDSTHERSTFETMEEAIVHFGTENQIKVINSNGQEVKLGVFEPRDMSDPINLLDMDAPDYFVTIRRANG